jgi:DNA-binding NtrC family response regulator
MHTSDLAGVSILILDDEVLVRKPMVAALEVLGADVTAASTIAGTRQLAGELNFDLVLLDVHLPDGLGTDLLRDKVFPESTGIIIMTAHGGISGAVEAMKLGAADYLAKPLDPAELPLVIGRVMRSRQSARINEHRRADELQSSEPFFFGSALAGLETQLDKILVADRRVQSPLPPVLILGETGTGKTTIARWLHLRGPRASQPLIEVNCSALPDTLAESELFGHERGAFTDARSTRMGLFEAAGGGTLFLDELPSLSPALQTKVLTAIEDRKIRRVGGNKPITVDVRIVAATNCDLTKQVNEGRFRSDLYHRLDLFRIQIPPLRDRGQDILSLSELLLRRLCQRHRLPLKRITDLGRKRLLAYRWPGNVRELSHELERAVVFTDGTDVDFVHLDTPATETGLENLDDWFNARFRFPVEGFQLERAINRLIDHALQQTNQNVSAAARILGVTRDYLRYRLENASSQTLDDKGKVGE